MRIHVSNLHAGVIESDVLRLFSRLGEVNTVQLMRDKLNNRSLGHAFVEMPVQEQAQKAVLQLHGSEVKGRKIAVSEVTYDPAPKASWNLSQDA